MATIHGHNQGDSDDAMTAWKKAMDARITMGLATQGELRQYEDLKARGAFNTDYQDPSPHLHTSLSLNRFHSPCIS